MTEDRSPRARILIVDDEPANIRVLAAALEDDYELRFATTGARALELAAAGDVDLVLLDVLMPDMSGFQLLARIRETPGAAGTPVIFVTAMDDDSDEARGLELGAVDYIAKPIRPPIVRARVATHIELKRQRDLLERYAFLDGLTGIANRRRFDDGFAQRCAEARLRGGPLSLLLVDVDHFKAFNDHYGHGRGDECLRAVARALQRSFGRTSDLVARYGGEEFAIVPAGALARDDAQRAIDAVRALGIAHAASTSGATLSISVGVAHAPAGRVTGSGALLEVADRALYAAKDGGRNRYCYVELGDPAGDDHGGTDE